MASPPSFALTPRCPPTFSSDAGASAFHHLASRLPKCFAQSMKKGKSEAKATNLDDDLDSYFAGKKAE